MNKGAVIITIAVLCVGLCIPTILNKFSYEANVTHKKNQMIKVFTPEELAKYDGIQESRLCLALMGTVYDVTKGSRNYVKGKAYHYFIGKDGSRSFVTGDFTDESEGKDDVLSLSCAEIFTLLNWQDTFDQKYDFVGVLEGRFFNENAEDTDYMKTLKKRVQRCKKIKKENEESQNKLPSCNVAWHADEGSKVWCTTKSGGVLRSWAGVPRQLYIPGREPQCVCVNLQHEESPNKYKLYKNCPPTSAVCIVEAK